MGKNLSLGKVIKEFSVLIPVYGLWRVDRQMKRGENPLIFQNMREDGRTGLEILAENESPQGLSSENRERLRYMDHKIRTGVFFVYHLLTSAIMVQRIFFPDSLQGSSYPFM